MNRNMHAHHRQCLMAELSCPALVLSSPVRHRNGDANYRYRPDSNLFWLTGFNEPEAALLLCPGQSPASIMFLREKDVTQEIWNGTRLGVENAPETLGVDAAYPISSLSEKLKEFLAPSSGLFLNLGVNPKMDQEILNLLTHFPVPKRSHQEAPSSLHNLQPLLGRLRLCKDQDEIQLMQQAADITQEAHCAVMDMLNPGVTENAVEATLQFHFLKHGAQPAYTIIAGAGDNANILHYTDNNGPCQEGDLILIDAGAEFQCYASDVTRTYPVSGTYTPAQKKVMEAVLRSHQEVIELIKPGLPYKEMHAKAVEVLTEELIDMGLLKGSLQDNIDQKNHLKYFMHGTGHHLGLDVHDPCPYGENGQSIPMKEGMVVTVEPGLYFSKQQTDIPDEFRGIGVRIEDDVLVTAQGSEVLTEGIPRSWQEIETYMQNNKEASSAS